MCVRQCRCRSDLSANALEQSLHSNRLEGDDADVNKDAADALDAASAGRPPFAVLLTKPVMPQGPLRLAATAAPSAAAATVPTRGGVAASAASAEDTAVVSLLLLGDGLGAERLAGRTGVPPPPLPPLDCRSRGLDEAVARE